MISDTDKRKNNDLRYWCKNFKIWWVNKKIKIFELKFQSSNNLKKKQKQIRLDIEIATYTAAYLNREVCVTLS